MSGIPWPERSANCVRMRKRRPPARRAACPAGAAGKSGREVERLLGVFADTVALLRERAGPLEVVVPTVPHLAEPIRSATKQWPLQPRIVVEAAEKQAAFRIARAALAKSGTVTLELAVAGVPTVGAYRCPLEAVVGRRLVKVSSVILADLVLANVVPEFIQEACTSEIWQRRCCRCSLTRPAAAPDRGIFPARCDDGNRIEGAGYPGRRIVSTPLAVQCPHDRVMPGRRRARAFITCGARSARSRVGWRRCRAGAGGRFSGADPRSFPSTGKSSRPCVPPRRAR